MNRYWKGSTQCSQWYLLCVLIICHIFLTFAWISFAVWHDATSKIIVLPFLSFALFILTHCLCVGVALLLIMIAIPSTVAEVAPLQETESVPMIDEVALVVERKSKREAAELETGVMIGLKQKKWKAQLTMASHRRLLF